MTKEQRSNETTWYFNFIYDDGVRGISKDITQRLSNSNMTYLELYQSLDLMDSSYWTLRSVFGVGDRWDTYHLHENESFNNFSREFDLLLYKFKMMEWFFKRECTGEGDNEITPDDKEYILRVLDPSKMYLLYTGKGRILNKPE